MSGQLHDTIMLDFFLSEDRKPAGKFWFIEGFVLWGVFGMFLLILIASNFMKGIDAHAPISQYKLLAECPKNELVLFTAKKEGKRVK